MFVKKFLLSVLFLFNLCCFGQNIKVSAKSFRPFKYKVLVANAFDEKYYNGNQIVDSAAVVNDRFEIVFPNRNSDIPYPYRFSDRITTSSFYQSSIFFVNPKTKNIILGKKNQPQNFDVFTDENLTNNEVLKFEKYFENFNLEKEKFQKTAQEEYERLEKNGGVSQEFWDNYQTSEKKLSVKEDSILLNFVKTNPNSFVALWKLVEKFDRNAYSEIYEETFNLLSSEMKSKQTAETLRLAIRQASIFQIGKKFPSPKIKNLNSLKNEFKIPKAKYVLIDFWFSHCKPCLDQMPNYVEIYSKYQPKGFEIVGIATDKSKFKKNLESTIEKFKIPWNNYWDENGKQSSEWTITSFPTNYLLDEKGNIIAKNISEMELSNLLNEKFK